MSGDDGLRVLGPCTECHAPYKDCTPPAHCCDDCLHLDPAWAGYEAEDFADLTFEPMPAESARLTCLPADEVAALRAKAAAADRVRKLADRFDASPYTHSNRTTADRIRRALDGDGQPC